MTKKPLLALLLILITPTFVGAFETDQFSNRQHSIADATAVMNLQVNLAIEESIAGWHGPHNEMKVVNRIYNKIGGRALVDKLERWAMESDEVERLDTPAYESVYQGHPFWVTRMAAFFGVGATLRINSVLVGADKIGHFLSQGRKFYRRWVRSHDEVQAAAHSAYTERAIFGQMMTGSYSNADLVANYEGYLFYRSLFEDNVIAGKPALLGWKQDHWVMQRPFDWADHVNDYWDEALNINHYDKLLYPRIKARLLTLCGDYYSDPELFEIHDEKALQERYSHLQLRETSELRMGNLCTDERNETFETTGLMGAVQ